MKQKITALLLGIFVLGMSNSLAQTLSVNNSDFSQAIYTFTAPQPNIRTINVDGSTYSVVDMTGSTPSTHIGRPNLPIVSQLVEIEPVGRILLI